MPEVSVLFMFDRHQFKEVSGTEDEIANQLIDLHRLDNFCGLHGRWSIDDQEVKYPSFRVDRTDDLEDKLDSIREDVRRFFLEKVGKMTKIDPIPGVNGSYSSCSIGCGFAVVCIDEIGGRKYVGPTGRSHEEAAVLHNQQTSDIVSALRPR